ncbi:uncharacterized protein TNCV_2932501 [Trichonephila clavipes]|nr:uncharacterized protein TNCV_2932501 [Trichonephila clavipes]
MTIEYRIYRGRSEHGMQRMVLHYPVDRGYLANLEDRTQLLEGHLTGRALDWFEVLGYRVVEDKASDYAQLKQAFTEQFPVKDEGFESGIPRYNQSENNRFRNRNRQENWREMRGNNKYSDNSRPQRGFNRFKGQSVGDNRGFDGRRRGVQSDHRFHNQGG